MTEPTNKELMVEIKNIGKRLDKLNGQVEKNTFFRVLHIGAYKTLSVLGAIVVGTVAFIRGALNG